MLDVVSDEMAVRVRDLLTAMNRGYWNELYWELQDDGAALFIKVTLDGSQADRRNILIVCAILRTVMSTLLPSSPHRTTWCASVEHDGKSLGYVLGGLKDDWRTLGSHGGLEIDEDGFEEMAHGDKVSRVR